MTGNDAVTGPGEDPKAGRFDPIARGFRVMLVVVGVAALASVATSGTTSDVLAGAAIAGMLVAPLARVLWLAQRWLRRGDIRYGLVAVSVLLIVGAGGLLAR